MHASILSAILFAAASVRAISVTSPAKDEKVSLGSSSYTVKWSTVSSDPTSAHIFLVNQAGGHTPYSKDLGVVDLTLGSYTVAAISGLSADTGYQFNIQSVSSTNTGILAQSQQFQIVADSSVNAVSVAGSGSSSAATPAGSSTSALATATGSARATTTSSASSTLTTATSSVTGTAAAASNGTATGASATSTAKIAGAAGKATGGSILGLAIVAAFALLI
jgi:hypothetical protein